MFIYMSSLKRTLLIILRFSPCNLFFCMRIYGTFLRIFFFLLMVELFQRVFRCALILYFGIFVSLLLISSRFVPFFFNISFHLLLLSVCNLCCSDARLGHVNQIFFLLLLVIVFF